MTPVRRTALVTALTLLVVFITGTAYGHTGAIPDTLRWLPITAPLVIWLLRVARRGDALPRTALDLPLAAALIWLGATVVFASERRLAFEFAWPHIAHILLLYLLVDLMRRGWAGAFRAALLVVALGIVAVSAVEVSAWYFGWLGEPGWFPVARWSSPLPPLLPTLDLALNISTIQGNTVAVLISLVATGAVAARSRWRRVGLSALALSLLVIEFLTFSRGGLLGALVAIGVLFAFGAVRWGGQSGRLRGLLQPRVVLAATLIAVLGVGLLMVVWSARPQRGASDQGRLDAWRSAVAMASDRPLTGVGAGLFGRALRSYRDPDLAQDKLVSAHNLPLNVLAETGVPGLLMLLWIALRFLRAWWRAWSAADPARRLWLEGALAALAAYAVHSLVDTFPLTSSVLPLLIAVAYVLAVPAPAHIAAPRARRAIAWAGIGLIALYGAALLVFDVAQGWMLASQRAVEQGDLDAALTRARRAQTWDPALSLYDVQEAYVLGLLASERPTEYLRPAIDAHQAALALEPTFDLGWANLAGLYAQAGDQAAAQEAMRRAAAINPQMAVYWWWLEEGERALAENPDLAEYVRDRDPAGLRAFLRDDERPAGLRLYVALLADQREEAARLVPEAQREGGWLAHLALGMHAQEVLRDPALALTWLARAVNARPEDERPALSRAEVEIATGRLDAAEADARRALFADRYGGAYANALLAQIERARGAPDEQVIALLRASVRPRPTPEYFAGTVYARPADFDLLPQLGVPGMASHFYAGWLALADLYVERGEIAPARALYRDLLALNPQLDAAAEALSALPDHKE
ncbi:MAG: O-antigen ligase family protein [Chloroflexota bacterium]